MIEDKLKEIIIQKYGTVKNFSIKVKIPYTTVDTILKRGIKKANVVNIIRICQKLDLDIEELIDGKIVYKE